MGHDLIRSINAVNPVLDEEQTRELEDALLVALEGYEVSETMDSQSAYQDRWLALEEAWARDDADAVSSFVANLESLGFIWRE